MRGFASGDSMLTPALYPTRVTHLRRFPVHRYAEHRSYCWYVDIDDLPQLPRWLRPFARFEAVDHFGGSPGDTLRARVDAFLADNGVSLPGGRVTALLLPRVLGRSFNPLSLFWCHDDTGRLRYVIAELQTVRGERRAHLMPSGELDSDPALQTLVFGDRNSLLGAPEPADNLSLTMSLNPDSPAGVVATWRGRRREVSIANVLLLQLTTPLAPQVAALTMRIEEFLLRLHRAPGLRPMSQTESAAHTNPVHAATAAWTGANSRSWAAS
jgi:uncharacterized protein